MRKTSQNVLRIPAAKVSSIITLLLIVRVSYNKVDLVEAAKVEKKEEIEKQVLLVLMVEMLVSLLLSSGLSDCDSCFLESWLATILLGG